MSLEIEQRLDNYFFTENSPKIYTTGAYLVPMKINSGDKIRFVWVVEEFNEDSYLEGEYCSPVVYSENLESLIVKENIGDDFEV